MDVLGVVDYVVDHLDFIMRAGPRTCKRPTVDAEGDINMVDAVGTFSYLPTSLLRRHSRRHSFATE